MASVRQTGRGWTARYRPYLATRQVERRVPASVWSRADDPGAAAQAWADTLDALADTLERWPGPDAIAEGERLGVITAGQARDLRSRHDPLGVAASVMDRPTALTVEEAWAAHPSTKREAANAPRNYADAARDVRRWIDWSGCRLVEDLTLERVQAYESHLANSGLAFETRKKAVRVLRRAAAVGKGRGIVDQLAGAVIGRRTTVERRQPRPRGWSLDEIAAMLVACERIDDARVGAAIALMGGMGLRISEVSRALVGDFDGVTISVGGRVAKTMASVRDLPVPTVLMPYLSRACVSVDRGHAIVCSLMPGRIGEPMGYRTCGRWLADQVHGLCGRRQPAKVLRASFASWCLIAGVQAGCYEAYMGHDVADVAQITREHYTTAAVQAWIISHGGAQMEHALAAAVDRARADEPAAVAAADRWAAHRESTRADRAARKAASTRARNRAG